ncbi:hypothetical protein ACSSNL_17855 [Thalassobius sp. S69A]|uniref:hypothetical protein n=1 Tax=unclassified Thalassovita TaxID=2619711 RepID=UPI003C7CA303
MQSAIKWAVRYFFEPTASAAGMILILCSAIAIDSAPETRQKVAAFLIGMVLYLLCYAVWPTVNQWTAPRRDGHVLRHPTKRELLVQAEIKDRRMAELEAKLAKAKRALLAISKWEVGPSGTTAGERSIKNLARATLAELEDGK